MWYTSWKSPGTNHGNSTTTLDQFRLRGLYVNESFRGQKVGEKLIHHVVQFCKATTAKEIFALVRVHNEKYFNKFGFLSYRETSKYEFGPHYLMKKIL